MKRVRSLWKTKVLDNQKHQKPYVNEQQQHNPDVEVIGHLNITLKQTAQEKAKEMVEVKPNVSDSICGPQEASDAFVPVAPPRKNRKKKLNNAPPPPIKPTVQNTIQDTVDGILEKPHKIGCNRVARIESLSEMDDDFSEIETVLKKEMLEASKGRNSPKLRKESQGNDSKIQAIEALYATVQKKSKIKEETCRLSDPNVDLQEDLNGMYAVGQKKNKIVDNVEKLASDELIQTANRESARQTVRLDIQLENTNTTPKNGLKYGPDTFPVKSDETIKNNFRVQENVENGFDANHDDIYDVLSDARNCRTPHRKAPDVKTVTKLEHIENKITSVSLQDKDQKTNENKDQMEEEVIYENVPTKERESKARKQPPLGYGSPFVLHAKAIKAELESKWKRNGAALYENVSYENVPIEEEVQGSEIDGNIIKSVQKNVENSSELHQSTDQMQAKTITSTNELENGDPLEVECETNSAAVLLNSNQKQVQMRIRLNSEGKLAPPKPLRKSMERLSFTENSQTLEEKHVSVPSEQPTAKPRFNIVTNSESDLNNVEVIENPTKTRPTAKPRAKLATGIQEAIPLSNKTTFTSEEALVNLKQDDKLMHDNELTNDKSLHCNASIVTDMPTHQHSCSEQNICSSEDTRHQEVAKPINVIEGQDVSNELLQKLNDISNELATIDRVVNSDHLTEKDQLHYYDSLLKLSARTDAIKGKGDVQVRTEKKVLLRKIQGLADILDNK